MKVVRLIQCRGMAILRQLQIEEALLRKSGDNWCLLNDGSSEPAIVMGISGKAHELLHEEESKEAGVQLIKRFSGGGTVIVDENTLFATLIMAQPAIPDVECYPRSIMRWSQEFYNPVFLPYGDFSLQEHDYAFGQRKFGGNAQAITKQRWLHHTSLLWDFDPARMQLLKHPSKIPEYRAGRSHLDFLCRLNEFTQDRERIFGAIVERLETIGFTVQAVDVQEAEEYLKLDYLRSNKVLF